MPWNAEYQSIWLWWVMFQYLIWSLRGSGCEIYKFLTDFQNSFFFWKLVSIAIISKSGCAIAHPAHPVPPALSNIKRFDKTKSLKYDSLKNKYLGLSFWFLVVLVPPKTRNSAIHAKRNSAINSATKLSAQNCQKTLSKTSEIVLSKICSVLFKI